MAPSRETIKLCKAPKDPGNPQSPRCTLPLGHSMVAGHQAIGRDGKPVIWVPGKP